MDASELREVERLINEARLIGTARHEERMRFADLIVKEMRETDEQDVVEALGRLAKATLV